MIIPASIQSCSFFRESPPLLGEQLGITQWHLRDMLIQPTTINSAVHLCIVAFVGIMVALSWFISAKMIMADKIKNSSAYTLLSTLMIMTFVYAFMASVVFIDNI